MAGERVAEVQIRRGNAAVPRDGFVLSGHGRWQSRLWVLQVGERLVLRRIGH